MEAIAGLKNHHENGSLAQLLRSYWLKFLDLRNKVKSWKKKKGVVALVGLRLGLGDSTDNTVQNSKVLNSQIHHS